MSTGSPARDTYQRLGRAAQHASVVADIIAYVLKYLIQRLINRRVFHPPALDVVLLQSFGIRFLPQECLQLFPRAKQMAGLGVMDKARVRIDPLCLPSIAANMLEDPHALYRRVALLAQGILRISHDGRLVHAANESTGGSSAPSTGRHRATTEMKSTCIARGSAASSDRLCCTTRGDLNVQVC